MWWKLSSYWKGTECVGVVNNSIVLHQKTLKPQDFSRTSPEKNEGWYTDSEIWLERKTKITGQVSSAKEAASKEKASVQLHWNWALRKKMPPRTSFMKVQKKQQGTEGQISAGAVWQCYRSHDEAKHKRYREECLHAQQQKQNYLPVF